ncbi:MAG: hypothetical protein HOW73_28965 [Polyangiaceae bacterium]|nr:hypothetical protein [Polyangiaceae bacterium]
MRIALHAVFAWPGFVFLCAFDSRIALQLSHVTGARSLSSLAAHIGGFALFELVGALMAHRLGSTHPGQLRRALLFGSGTLALLSVVSLTRPRKTIADTFPQYLERLPAHPGLDRNEADRAASDDTDLLCANAERSLARSRGAAVPAIDRCCAWTSTDNRRLAPMKPRKVCNVHIRTPHGETITVRDAPDSDAWIVRRDERIGYWFFASGYYAFRPIGNGVVIADDGRVLDVVHAAMFADRVGRSRVQDRAVAVFGLFLAGALTLAYFLMARGRKRLDAGVPATVDAQGRVVVGGEAVAVSWPAGEVVPKGDVLVFDGAVSNADYRNRSMLTGAIVPDRRGTLDERADALCAVAPIIAAIATLPLVANTLVALLAPFLRAI